VADDDGQVVFWAAVFLATSSCTRISREMPICQNSGRLNTFA